MCSPYVAPNRGVTRNREILFADFLSRRYFFDIRKHFLQSFQVDQESMLSHTRIHVSIFDEGNSVPHNFQNNAQVHGENLWWVVPSNMCE